MKKQGFSYEIAIDLPAAIKAELARICCGLQGIQWQDEQNFHLILRSLGVLEDNQALDIAESLNQINLPPFELSINGISHTLAGRGNGILWASVRENADLIKLKKLIDKSLVDLQVPKEKKEAHGPIILGKFERLNENQLIDFLTSNSLFASKSFLIEAFSLFSSHITEKRVFYVEEGTFKLKNKGFRPTNEFKSS